MKIVTAAIVKNEKGEILITRRKTGEKNEGYWEFPGGKLHHDETLEECLQRELHEELGVDSSIGKLIAESIYEYAQGKIKLIAFEATLTSFEFQLTVHDRHAWVDYESLLSYDLTPADIPIAKIILERISSI